ncbi:hypothetical protein Cgig2_001296 [Carnegiea gigantea]|uniref:Trichome birefringence-like C-terminal domain-containing protein n=1 Tax=Carnegiea gigantea TaxID=171969 RepID=A0A9Q1QKF3_9CARY|nr:hypothetical protein Cgig2_001296 [Carnegiea gigantea]
MLERLRDKRMVLVGNSLNRNQWSPLPVFSTPPSLHLRLELIPKSHTYKVLKVKDYNFTLEFYWSPFIIELDEKNESGSKVLNLDKLPATSEQWRGADIMDLFQHQGKLIDDMPIEQAFKLGMETWERWVSNNLDPKKSTLFFGGISPEHQTQWCYNSTQPAFDEPYASKFPNSLIETIEGLIEKMNENTIVVNYMNITKLSQYRRDAHPSIYSSMQWEDGLEKLDLRAFADCSQRCLPGLPDTWNRLLHASLLFDSSGDV